MNRLVRFYNERIRYEERTDKEREYTLRKLYFGKVEKFFKDKLKDISEVIKENENN